ncbi:MAG: tetratricopeptide repeat protein, partial [Pseudomonadota bacterium]
GEYQAAARALIPLARAGDARAQTQLGLLYFFGRGVAEDEKAALAWLKKAANQGHVEAMLHLGNALVFGADAPRLVADPDREAAQWYFRAASAGNADAQYNLGLLFLAGKGVMENREEALRWIRRAAAQNHPAAQRFVAGLPKGN